MDPMNSRNVLPKHVPGWGGVGHVGVDGSCRGWGGVDHEGVEWVM